MQDRTSPGSGSRASLPLGLVYAAIREGLPSPTAAEAGAADPDPADLLRLCRRLGAIPKTWPDARARNALPDVLAEMARAHGCSAQEAGEVLARFAADGGPGARCGSLPECSGCPVRPYCAYPDARPTIKDLPAAERPRERLLQGGSERLSDRELLAIIIGGGTRNATALDLAGRLLETFQDFRRLAECSPAELMRVQGIGPAKAAQVTAALAIARRYAGGSLPAGQVVVSGSESLFGYMREKFHGMKKEQFVSLLLDTKHKLIREDEVAVGSLNESVVHPREVFSAAIRHSAAKVLFVHNHPSGNPEPSPQDRRLTARLVDAGRLVGIQVLDHMIIGRDTYFSFAEHGLIAPSADRSGAAPT